MRMKKQELNYITGSSNEGGDLWSEDYPGVSKWKEAQTDRLDYDLRYEYLKVYPAVNSESKISEYTEDGDLIRAESTFDSIRNFEDFGSEVLKVWVVFLEVGLQDKPQGHFPEVDKIRPAC
ncbi:hypothetical protein BY996DRAFT_6614299 [Phakopsora pachyrhizi]|nr:hypothetical protein BY996DRAFT_6614299 [Phakopsora pachyrhizi]